jgi:hypothetical protein
MMFWCIILKQKSFFSWTQITTEGAFQKTRVLLIIKKMFYYRLATIQIKDYRKSLIIPQPRPIPAETQECTNSEILDSALIF